VLLSVFFNTSNPLKQLAFFELLQGLAKGIVELLDVFELLALLDRCRKGLKALHGLMDSVKETAGPIKSTSDWGHVRRNRRAFIDALNEDFSLLEDLLSCLQVILENLKKIDLLALKLILDDGSVQETFEGVEHLELANNGVAVIEGLGEDGSETTFELLHALTEGKEVVIKLTLLDVKDVVLDEHEVLNSFGELVEDSHDVSGHGLALGVTNFNLLQLAKLVDSASQVHDVLAALRKGIKAHKERVGGDLPLVLALGLVLEVCILELGAHIEGKGQLLVSIPALLVLDGFEHFVSVNSRAALLNDSIADLADKYDQASGSVVVLGVIPDQ